MLSLQLTGEEKERDQECTDSFCILLPSVALIKVEFNERMLEESGTPALSMRNLTILLRLQRRYDYRGKQWATRPPEGSSTVKCKRFRPGLYKNVLGSLLQSIYIYIYIDMLTYCIYVRAPLMRGTQRLTSEAMQFHYLCLYTRFHCQWTVWPCTNFLTSLGLRFPDYKMETFSVLHKVAMTSQWANQCKMPVTTEALINVLVSKHLKPLGDPSCSTWRQEHGLKASERLKSEVSLDSETHMALPAPPLCSQER